MDSYFGDGRCLAQDPSQPNVMYAGGNHWDGRVSAYTMAVCKSSDGGTSWTQRRDLTTKSGMCLDIAVAPSSRQIVYAAGEESSAGRIFRSGDGGTTWSNVTNNLATFHSGAWQVKSVWVHPADCNCVYVGASRGVYVSRNGGQRWASAGLAFPAKGFAYDPATGILYAATENNGVWFLRNGGPAWENLNQGLGALNGLAVAMDPVNRYLFFATNGVGVWRTRPVAPLSGATRRWVKYP